MLMHGILSTNQTPQRQYRFDGLPTRSRSSPRLKQSLTFVCLSRAFHRKTQLFSVNWKITKMFLQRIKGIKPVGILWYSLQPCILLHCFSKIAQLNPLRGTMWAHEAGMEHSLSLAISFCSILISIICWQRYKQLLRILHCSTYFCPKT